MSFGGFFGGGGGGGNNKPSSSSSSSSSNETDSQFSSPSSSSPLHSQPQSQTSIGSNDSTQIRQRLQNAIAIQANVINAKFLIDKVNENCFAHCITYPGSSLSSKEQTCLSGCMEKYFEAWNITSRVYVNRLQKEGAQLQSLTSGGGGGNGPGVGRELF